jgi:hypothetical protein
MVVIYDNGTNGFKSRVTIMLYAGETSAEVCGGIRNVVPELKVVNVYVSGCAGRGVV